MKIKEAILLNEQGKGHDWPIVFEKSAQRVCRPMGLDLKAKLMALQDFFNPAVRYTASISLVSRVTTPDMT